MRRGRVLPFDLVQRELLADDLRSLDSVSDRITAIDGELSEMVEGLTEDDKAALGEALNDAGDAFVASKLRKAVNELLRWRRGRACRPGRECPVPARREAGCEEEQGGVRVTRPMYRDYWHP